MVQLSLLEEIKDKASRLIPTAYMEIVEECTAPHLLIPTYEHMKFLCETVNKKPDTIVDVVRALRRRIADSDVAVKHLTVQLLESMIKNTTTAFHIEVASQKGLLRDLVNVACMQPTTGRAMQAKEAALLLTLNLSIWFRGHPAEECYILTTLADDVRNQLGPNCFEGIEPERNTRVRVQVNAPPPARAAPRASDSRAAAGRGATQRQDKRPIVDAIPIDLPTPERVSAMLDACMTFSEYLHNVEMDTDKPLTKDEVVQSYLSQVKADHDYVTMLLTSNLQLDRDLLRTISDSQTAVLRKVSKVSAQLAARTGTPAAPQQPQHPTQQSAAVPVSALPHTPVRSAVDTEGLQRGMHSPSRATPPRAEVAAHGAATAAPAPAPPPQVPPPSVDDLFGDAVGAATSISSSNAVGAPAPAPAPAPAVPSAAETARGSCSVPAPPPSLNPSIPSQSTSVTTPVETAPAAPALAVHVDAAAAVAKEEKKAEEVKKVEEEKAAAPEQPVEERKEVHPEPSEKAEQHDTEKEAAPFGKDENAKEEEADALKAPVAPAAPAPTRTTAAPPKDDDDFDAFLDGRM